MVTVVLAASVALAAELTSRAPSLTAARGAPADIDTFLTPVRRDRGQYGFDGRLKADPLAGRASSVDSRPVARAGGVPTVSSSGRRERRLTAILISDDRAIAVIDEAVVSVGDRLPDGARIDAIQSDRVSVVERSGQKRVLTLTTGRP